MFLQVNAKRSSLVPHRKDTRRKSFTCVCVRHTSTEPATLLQMPMPPCEWSDVLLSNSSAGITPISNAVLPPRLATFHRRMGDAASVVSNDTTVRGPELRIFTRNPPYPITDTHRGPHSPPTHTDFVNHLRTHTQRMLLPALTSLPPRPTVHATTCQLWQRIQPSELSGS